MAAKKSSGSGRSARTGAVTARAETSIAKNKKSTKTAKHSKTAATAKVGKAGKVAKGGSQKLKSGASAIKVGPMVEKVPVETVAVEQLRAEKVPVTGRMIKLGAVDRGHARVLEEVITGASEVTITAGPGTGKSTTLTGVLLGVLRTVTDALEHGEAVTIVGEQTQEGLAGAAISSQEAADLLNVSRPHVVKLAKTGQLAHHLVGNRHRFALADVLAYAERMRIVRSEALAAIAPADRYTAEDF